MHWIYSQNIQRNTVAFILRITLKHKYLRIRKPWEHYIKTNLKYYSYEEADSIYSRI